MSEENRFYQIDRAKILSATTPEYRQFLRESGYGDLDSCLGIEIAKGVLKIDHAVRQAAASTGLSLSGNNGDYVVNINHPDARELVEALGYKVPTVGLMYNLFIPYIKELAEQGNAEAQETLGEMIGPTAEWLEDLIKGKNKVCIGSRKKELSLPDKEGRFGRQDINDFGYPVRVKDTGEFYYRHPRGKERAAVRNRYSELDLNLNWESSVSFGGLGVRPQKIFV